MAGRCACLFWLLARAGGSDDGQRPLFFWVSPETKVQLQEAAAAEGLGLADAFERWVDLRSAAAGVLRAEANQVPMPDAAGDVDAIQSGHQTPSAQEVYSALPERVQSRFLRGLWPGMRDIAGSSGRLLLTWTGGKEFVQLARNLALSIKKHVPSLLPHFCVVALDDEAEMQLRSHGICALISEDSLVSDPDRWDFKKRLLGAGLVLGLEVLVLDADCVILQDPFLNVWNDSDLETGTDHMFPERDLWQPHMRLEEHLNTGFLYANGKARGGRLLCFLDILFPAEIHWRSKWNAASFLHIFAEPDLLGLPRDFFDQRAFNKFVLMHLAAAPPMAQIRYGKSQVELPSWPPERLAVAEMLGEVCGLCRSASQPLVIRVLDPEIIAHGMNYFRRATHLHRQPAVVHANGVDAKVYFMRDRGIWFVDDWSERFPVDSRFLTYGHPPGLDLKGDFNTLLAALEVAKVLKRRLVLPRTMHCANSPAHAAYQLPLQECTVDHFASPKILLRYYNESLVESLVATHPQYQALLSSSSWTVGPADADALLEDPRTSTAAVLNLEVDVVEARDSLFQGLQAFPDSVPKPACKFAYWPGRQMACRDEAYLRKVGQEKACNAEGQEACGVKGFSCCEVFHGWAEKLEVFTGRPWDLPCNCGLERCAQFHRTSDYPQLGENHRCCFRKHEDPPMLQCIDVGVFPSSIPAMDFNSYSSDVLWALKLRGSEVFTETFQACWRWTQAASVSMSMSTRSNDVGRECTWIVSSFLLVHDEHALLDEWLGFMLRQHFPNLEELHAERSGGFAKLQSVQNRAKWLLKRSWSQGAEGAAVEIYDIYRQATEGVPREELFPYFTHLEGILRPLAQSKQAAPSDGIPELDLDVLQDFRWSLLSPTVWRAELGVELHICMAEGFYNRWLVRLAQRLRREFPDLFRSPSLHAQQVKIERSKHV
ncbi:unnamed protein product [Effrenium voratum]|nr:unnamed protein product [Effrenium voratum]